MSCCGTSMTTAKCPLKGTFSRMSHLCRCVYPRKSSPILDYKHLARSWSQFLGSQPAVDLVINPMVGCRYFPPGQQLLFEPNRSPPWPAPNYTAWWRGKRVWAACPKPLRNGAQPGLEPATCELQVHCPANSASHVYPCNICKTLCSRTVLEVVCFWVVRASVHLCVPEVYEQKTL